MSYWSWIFSASPSYFSRMAALASGATTSEIAMVTPEREAHLKPASLSASRLAPTSTLGYRSARSLTIAPSTFLSTTPLMYG